MVDRSMQTLEGQGVRRPEMLLAKAQAKEYVTSALLCVLLAGAMGCFMYGMNEVESYPDVVVGYDAVVHVNEDGEPYIAYEEVLAKESHGMPESVIIGFILSLTAVAVIVLNLVMLKRTGDQLVYDWEKKKEGKE